MCAIRAAVIVVANSGPVLMVSCVLAAGKEHAFPLCTWAVGQTQEVL